MPIKSIFFDLGNTLVTNSKTWFEGAKEVLATLKLKGFHLGVISNTADLARPAILDLLPPDFSLSDFDPQLVLFSSELGIAKPDPAIFREAVRRADVPPGDCLYCSENPVETQAAEQSAMLAIRVHFPPIIDLSTLQRRIEEIHAGVNPNKKNAGMNRFQRVVQILDNAVGGPTMPVGFPHGPFWRDVTRDVFVARKVLGMDIITVGDGAGSMLVKALKGEPPFGEDIPRMPPNMAAVPDLDIAFIEQWIDDGCLEDEGVETAPLNWKKTNAPEAGSRTDDVWFIDPNTGWAVNSDGKIIKTEDGGDSWTVQATFPFLYLRCIAFADANIGWVGTISPARRLLHTPNGGGVWQPVTNLPPQAPVKVCGLSVVDDQVVYCSGTNEPNDLPRMMKTTDGGATWSAWSMEQHASILIDCYFRDPLHGWVVGGKAGVPNPTTRDKVKPVVLETTDGGATWTNRLAGQEGDFPFGEWGWKIHWLNDQIGFVSLENFTDAAILKTSDGGVTWNRIKVNDAQGNANLEGVGFLDERRGWVGGWGPGGFVNGFSSATVDGGITWSDANEIGLFINRFRFFGDPVTVGYASGKTVYKYSSEPEPARAFAPKPPDDASAKLSAPRITGRPEIAKFNIQVPAGAKRLSLFVWDRFGGEVGSILDEIRPQSGSRVFEWNGLDTRGKAVAPGDYIARLVIDEVTASTFVSLYRSSPRTAFSSVAASRRFVIPTARRSPFSTLKSLVAAPAHDEPWLHLALQTAIELELATLPPYLTARWTIVPPSPAIQVIKQIAREEMLHMGLACNLLAAVGGTPLIADGKVVPRYPGPLPWGIRPGLTVGLRKLDKEQLKVFMEIEYPQHGPIGFDGGPTTIGEFYFAILQAFKDLAPPLSLDRQLEGPLEMFKIGTMEDVETAIDLINAQGEGSNSTPEEAPGKLAHHYEFGQFFKGKRFIKTGERWDYDGPDVEMPAVVNMADVPEGGYQKADVPDAVVWELIERFDRQYSEMLRLLQKAWTHGDEQILSESVGKMIQMGTTARALIAKPKPDGNGNYGPCFRLQQP